MLCKFPHLIIAKRAALIRHDRYETLEGAGGCNEFSANRVEKHRSWQRPGRVSPDDYSDSAQLEQWLLSEASALLHREDVDPAMGLFHQGFSK